MAAITFANVANGKSNADVKAFQQALTRKGFKVTADGIFGAKTTAATKAFQLKQGWQGPGADGKPGPLTFAKLGLTPKAQASGEPAHVYTRVTWRGRTVNVRTREMLKDAEARAGRVLSLVQGSYNKGVSASAGTHDGGGVVDVSTAGMSANTIRAVCQSMRKAGFAAWHRTPPSFSSHIHACAIGDREMAPVAREQVQQYFNGQNGLAGHGPDSNPPRPFPGWAAKYNK